MIEAVQSKRIAEEPHFEAAIGGVALVFGSSDGHEKRAVWLRYGRWLVAALTFQLAADIIETSIAPTWDDVGRLAVIAIVRTFLNYFFGKGHRRNARAGETEGRKVGA